MAMMPSRTLSLTFLFYIALSTAAPAADAPRVKELRTQQVGDTTYFHVSFYPPGEMDVPLTRGASPWEPVDRRALSFLPCLVPQDNQSRTVYLRLNFEIEKDRERKIVGVKA